MALHVRGRNEEVIQANCLVRGCYDCDVHRRGVTGWDINRENEEKALCHVNVFGMEMPVVLR